MPSISLTPSVETMCKILPKLPDSIQQNRLIITWENIPHPPQLYLLEKTKIILCGGVKPSHIIPNECRAGNHLGVPVRSFTFLEDGTRLSHCNICFSKDEDPLDIETSKNTPPTRKRIL